MAKFAWGPRTAEARVTLQAAAALAAAAAANISAQLCLAQKKDVFKDTRS